MRVQSDDVLTDGSPKILETPDCFDFTQYPVEELANLLQRFNLRLTVDEAITIQNFLLKRPPTYA